MTDPPSFPIPFYALTPRELSVASMVARGMSCKGIAYELGIGERRVRVLTTSIAYKIKADPGLDERVQVANWWNSSVITHPKDGAA